MHFFDCSIRIEHLSFLLSEHDSYTPFMPLRFQQAADNMSGATKSYEWPPVLADTISVIPARGKAALPTTGVPHVRSDYNDAAMLHIGREVFQLDLSDMNEPISAFLQQSHVTDPEEFLFLTDEQIDRAQYVDAANDKHNLPNAYKSLLKAFRNYCIVYCRIMGLKGLKWD